MESHQVLTPEQELGYFYLYNDPTVRLEVKREVKEILILSNQGLIGMIAKRYAGRVPWRDLMAYGNIGLLKAIEDFKPELGFKFSTYGWWKIRAEIGRSVRNEWREIRLPTSLMDEVRKLEKIEERRPLTEKEEARLDRLTDFILRSQTESYDKPLSEEECKQYNLFCDEEDWQPEENFTLDDITASKSAGPNDVVCLQEAQERIREVIASALTHREARVIELRFGIYDGEERTLKATGEIMGDYSPERIRQIEANALGKLRDSYWTVLLVELYRHYREE